MAHRDLDVGLSFMFGPPEPANLRALLRAGAVVTGSVRRYTRALRARGLGLRLPQFVPAGVLDRLLRPQASVLTLETLGRAPDPRVEQVWDATALDASPGEVLPVGDARFYAWRFGLSAGGRQEGMIVLDAGRPVGVAAVERHGERRAIVDVTCTHSSFRKVVQAILASSAGADAVDIQIHIPCRMKELALWTLGFVPRGTKAFQVQLRVDDGARALLTTPAAWNYMWGDGDLGSVYE
jgi:hypothetical protein